MSLKPCRECREQVSSKALICPRCGIKNPITSEAKLGFGVFAGVLIFIMMVANFNKPTDQAANRQQDSVGQNNARAMTEAIKSIVLSSGAIIEERNDNNPTDYTFTLHYGNSVYVDIDQAERDTKRVVRAALTELLKEGRSPSKEAISIAAFAQQDGFKGETGQPLVRSLGWTHYDANDDGLVFSPTL